MLSKRMITTTVGLGLLGSAGSRSSILGGSTSGARSRYSIGGRSLGRIPIEPRKSFMKTPSWAAAPTEASAAAPASAATRANATIPIGPTVLFYIPPRTG